MIKGKNIKTYIEKGWRWLKLQGFGKDDVLQAKTAMPFGIDSAPVKDCIAIYAETSVRGETVCVGVLFKNMLADVGETRLYSTDADGAQQTYIWLKNDGTILLGGDSNFAVKFNELKTEFNEFKTKFNNHITAYNSHVHPGVTTGSGSSGVTLSVSTQSTANIDNAKNENIKTN